MRCKEARRRWHDRLDTGVTDPQLDRHLKSCADCREYAVRMTRVVGLLESLGRETEHIASSSEILRDQSSAPISPPKRLYFKLLRVAAAIAVVVLAGLWFVPHSSRRTELATHDSPPNAAATRESVAEGGIVLNGESKSRFLAVAVQTGDERIRAYRLYPQPLP